MDQQITLGKDYFRERKSLADKNGGGGNSELDGWTVSVLLDEKVLENDCMTV